DTTTEIACPGDESYLWNRCLVIAWPWKHVADLGNSRLLRSGIKFRTKHLSRGVLENPGICPQQLLYGGNELAVAEVKTEWIDVAILKAALSVVKHRQRCIPVRLYSGNSLIEHGLRLLRR